MLYGGTLKKGEIAMARTASSRLLDQEARGSLLTEASALIGELQACDWPIPLTDRFLRDDYSKLLHERATIEEEEHLRRDSMWRHSDKQADCADLNRKIEQAQEDLRRHSIWRYRVDVFLYACRSHVNTFGDLEQMRRLEGNVMWQVVVVYGADGTHSLSYLKDQCLADLHSLKTLIEGTPIPSQSRRTREVKPSRIGKNVRLAREACGQTQSDAADEIGITQPMLSRFETGDTQRLIGPNRDACLGYIERHLSRDSRK